MLQELEAPCTAQPHTLYPTHPTNPNRAAVPPTGPPSHINPPLSSQHHYPLHRPDMFSPDTLGVSPITPIGMHLDAAMTPEESSSRLQLPPRPTGAASPSPPTSTPPFLLHAQARASCGAAFGNAGAGGDVGVPMVTDASCPPSSRLHTSSSVHHPHRSHNSLTSAEAGMLLDRVPATPVSRGWPVQDVVTESAPEFEHHAGGYRVTDRPYGQGVPQPGSHVEALHFHQGASEFGGCEGQAQGDGGGGVGQTGGQGEQCTTPQGVGGGETSDMEADNTPPGIQPTPVRTRVVGPGPHPSAILNPQLPRIQQQQQQQQQHHHHQQPHQQQGAGRSERGEGCGLAGNLDVATCRADWLYHRYYMM